MNNTNVKATQKPGPNSKDFILDLINNIVDKRVTAGKVEYCLKLLNYSENIWVPVEELTCKNLIKQYEDECKKSNEQDPFKYKADLIIGLKIVNGQKMFLIKWKNMLKADLVPVEVANEKYAQVVIEFYQKRIQWVEPHRNNNNGV